MPNDAVTFTPTGTGIRSGAINILDASVNSPQTLMGVTDLHRIPSTIVELERAKDSSAQQSSSVTVVMDLGL